MRPLPVSPTRQSVQIGVKLRAARTGLGLTLDQLAASSGLTKGFLSRVERDEASLSVASLITLCEVMSLEVGSLFSEPDVALVRHDSAPAINLGGTGVDERLMTPRRQSRVQLVRTSASPRATGGRELYTINCALEVLYVVKGVVDLIFNHGHQRVTAGDALTFPGGEPHTWRNASASRSAELLWLMLPAPWSGSD